MTEPKIDRVGLFNEIEEGVDYPHNDKWYSHLLDQYKLYVEMTDRISQRRATANTYFLSLNSAILAFVGYLSVKETGEYNWMLACGGIALCILWRRLIISYTNLNTAKFKVIHNIEKRLPISPYEAEWIAMGEGKTQICTVPFLTLNKVFHSSSLSCTQSYLFACSHGTGSPCPWPMHLNT